MLQRTLPAGFIAPRLNRNPAQRLRQTEIHFILRSQTGDHGHSRVSIAQGATMTDVETALANCRALINQINAGLSAKEPFVDLSSAAELIFYLERAASALKRSASPQPIIAVNPGGERSQFRIEPAGPSGALAPWASTASA
jgi:Domain of Unknown Function (DUF1080)